MIFESAEIFASAFFFCCQVSLKVPVVVRLEGTNVDQGKRILKVYVLTLFAFNALCHQGVKYDFSTSFSSSVNGRYGDLILDPVYG